MSKCFQGLFFTVFNMLRHSSNNIILVNVVQGTHPASSETFLFLNGDLAKMYFSHKHKIIATWRKKIECTMENFWSQWNNHCIGGNVQTLLTYKKEAHAKLHIIHKPELTVTQNWQNHKGTIKFKHNSWHFYSSNISNKLIVNSLPIQNIINTKSLKQNCPLWQLAVIHWSLHCIISDHACLVAVSLVPSTACSIKQIMRRWMSFRKVYILSEMQILHILGTYLVKTYW